MNYSHTQTGYVMLAALTTVILLSAYGMTQTTIEPIAKIIIAFIAFILASFSTLTVTINHEYLRIRFGWGIYKKRFPLKDIKQAKAVKNAWYHGWGIRYGLWPKMITIYNVSGFDAVEITTKEGRIYRIGTDEPDKLERTINGSIR